MKKESQMGCGARRLVRSLCAMAVLSVLAASGCGAASGDESWSEEDGELGETAQAWLGEGCSSTSANQCWHKSFSGPNYRTFTFGRGLGCGILTAGTGTGTYTYKQVWCGSSGHLFANPVGHASSNREAPDNLKSLAIEKVPGSMRIYALGENNVVYKASSSWPTSNWYNGFASYSTYSQPVDNLGNSLCLKKIDVAYVGNFQAAPAPDLLALTCDGKLYYSGTKNGSRVWYHSSNKKPWSLLNNSNVTDGPYKDFGHTDIASDPYPLYLLTSDGKVISVGRSSFSATGARTWYGPLRVPDIPNLTPIAIGGPFVITNAGNNSCPCKSKCTFPVGGAPCAGDDDRFYVFDQPSFKWYRQDMGTPSLLANAVDAEGGQPYEQIVDASLYLTSNGAEMGVWHRFNRVYTFSWF